MAVLGAALEPITGGLKLAIHRLEVEISFRAGVGRESGPAAGCNGDGLKGGRRVDGEARTSEDAGAAKLFLMKIESVRTSVGSDFHQHAAHTVTAEAVLGEDQDDEDEAGSQGNQPGGDEEFVALAGFREDEEIYRANEDAEENQDGDEKCIAEGLCAEEILKWPRFLEIVLLRDVLRDVLRHGGIGRDEFHDCGRIQF